MGGTDLTNFIFWSGVCVCIACISSSGHVHVCVVCTTWCRYVYVCVHMYVMYAPVSVAVSVKVHLHMCGHMRLTSSVFLYCLF